MRSLIFHSESLYRLSLRARFGATDPRPPQSSLPNQALRNRAAWQQADRLGRQLHLPLHRASEKNWDHLAAVYAILRTFPKTTAIFDAGAELYSNVLPALFACGYRNLYGMNLAFTNAARRGPIRYLPGDITRTGFADASFDAITCMSVIEHGVPLEPYFRESLRILKPGGLLITSTDYYPTPIDTAGKLAYGAPVKIFTKEDVQAMVALATSIGFETTGPIDFACDEPSVRWENYQLDFSFLVFTLRKPAHA
jgi:SAM-dependent methyltransferase